MEEQGWISLHRKLKGWEWYTDVNTCHLFINLLLSANHKPKKHQGIIINIGQIKTGRIRLSMETGLSEQQIRTSLKRLESTSEITITKHNKYSIITITKWGEYQRKKKESTSELTINQPATNQQLTTNNNVNNKNNDNKQECFDLFWIEYPRKEDKRGAKKKFNQLMKEGINHEEIVEGATKFKLHCKANSILCKYIKLPATWLNAGSWENGYKSGKSKIADERTDLLPLPSIGGENG